MTNTLAEHISIEKIGEGVYASRYPPQRMGNATPIAYGGYAIGYGIHAAYQNVPEGFHLYSVLGHYLRAANIEEKLVCKTTELRRSRSFITYRVTIEQKQIGGEVRSCVELLAEFHRDEPALLTYAASPTRKYSHWKDCTPWEKIARQWSEAGKIPEAISEIVLTSLEDARIIYECRPCPEGAAYHNLMAVVKTAKTNQEGLSPTEKSSADWIRVDHPLQTEGEQMASLGFLMDGMLSFLPLIHNHLSFDDVAACSTLDFALRVFSPRIDMNHWHLREVISHHAGHGRSYSESRLWDEQGSLVASMTQQAIIRVPVESAKI